jgi:hypothetical protein
VARQSATSRAGLLLVGFAAAVLLRVAVGAPTVARSEPAGVLFAATLLLLAWAAARGRPVRWSAGTLRRSAVIGVAGAVVLCIPAGLSWAGRGFPLAIRPVGSFPVWALVVAVVALAEEAFLRGVLYRTLEPYGLPVAIGIPAVAFAALHVPLYGWGAAPLDLAVGIWLGALRAVCGSALAPGLTHTLADWAAWWLA